jgi:hypothetical protein
MKHKDLLEAMAANERAELYFAAHPGSPAAVRRPQLWIRSGKWVAVLGRNIQEGIVGIGATVEMALRAFDDQYLAALRPPGERRTANHPIHTAKPISGKGSINSKRNTFHHAYRA